jgi:hypothetical protein
MVARALAEHPSPEGVTHTVVLTRPDGIQAVVQAQTERSGNVWSGYSLVPGALTSPPPCIDSTGTFAGRATNTPRVPARGVLPYPLTCDTLVP